MKQAKNKAGTREIVVYGVDSETQHGPPISIQFHSDDDPRGTAILQVEEKTATAKFFAHLRKHCAADKHYRLYGHYLEFDMLSFMWSQRDKLVMNHGAFEFAYHNWHVLGCYGRPTFARITSSDGHLIELVDSGLWFYGSLDSAAELHCPDLRKLPRPEGLGDKWFSVKNTAFAAYAMRDAEIAARLGALVERFQQEHELPPALSLASQAASIFRRSYIQEPIEQCPTRYMEAALAAYHGGKNNVIPGAAPAWHENVAMYDISSAYPWAMTELPAFDAARRFKPVSLPARTQKVPTPGIYKVTGRVLPCKWPILFTHDFKPIRAPRVEDLWIHGYELNEAISAGEFSPSARIQGMYYDDDGGRESATARFAREFYRHKSEAANPFDRHMYKILLNSLSGKFIQTRPVDSINVHGQLETEYVAGGLFQPFIAGAITAHTRAHIHRIEHAYKAYHTATDGVIAPVRERRPALGLPSKGLGALNEEMRGNVVILRNKLYIGYDQEPGGRPSAVFSNWNVRKFAMHGFQGKVDELERLVVSGRRWYVATHRIGLREALKHDLIPNDFVQRQMSLAVGPIKHGKTKK